MFNEVNMKTVELKIVKMRMWECPVCNSIEYENYDIVMEHTNKRLKRRVNCGKCGFVFKYVLPNYRR